MHVEFLFQISHESIFIWLLLDHGSEFFSTGQIVNILGLEGHIVSVTTTLPLYESSHRQYGNEWAWLGSNETLFTKTY